MATTSRTWSPAARPPGGSLRILNTANALNKGGDAAVFFEGGRRFLHAEPLYAGSSAADGFIGPPFQAMFFAPFAAVASASPVAAKLLWHALNLACFGLGVWLSLKAWDAARGQIGLLPARRGSPCSSRRSSAILLPLADELRAPEHECRCCSRSWQARRGN